MPEENTAVLPAPPPIAPSKEESELTPVGPDTMLAEAQKGIKPVGLDNEFDEISRIAAENTRPQKQAKPAKRTVTKPEKESTRRVVTAKPQSLPPDRPAEEAESVDLRKMKEPAPEDLVEDFMTPRQAEVEKAEAGDETEELPEERERKPEDEDVEESEGEEEDAEKPEEEELKGKPVQKLRNAYEQAKKRLKELESEVTKLKTSPREDPEKVELNKKLEESATRLQELQDELRYANYQRSDDYKQKYSEPIRRAFESAYEEVGTMQVLGRKDDMGEVLEPDRQATAEDFNALLRMSTADAVKAARAMFGDASPEVLHHRRRILELNHTAENAIKEYREKGTEIEKARLQQTEKQKTELKKIWDETTKDIAEKYPNFFKPVDGDDEANKLLDKGYQVADYALSNPKIEPEKVVRLHAMMRHKAAAFDAVVHRFREQLKAAKAEADELRGELKDYQKSEPTSGDRRGRKAEAAEDDWRSEIDVLARGNS